MSDDSYTKSRFADYDGLSRFKNGECKYIIGFTEDIRRLEKGNYKVQPLNMSDNAINEMPLYPIDLASLGKNVSGEKLLDCLDLMEIISNSDFIYKNKPYFLRVLHIFWNVVRPSKRIYDIPRHH